MALKKLLYRNKKIPQYTKTKTDILLRCRTKQNKKKLRLRDVADFQKVYELELYNFPVKRT